MSMEELVKKRDLLRGISIGVGIVYMAIITFVIYLFAINGFKIVSFAALIPVFALPGTFTPILANISLLNKEIQSRASNI